ncbi:MULTISPECIES: NAD(P)H-dependent oxidoreductase [Vibrio]|uniref:NAD(P)H-dependent oxidoreductase n=1 Tax=Vibrio TaxID=662 RepID=UPI00058654F0|nr:MULTISPECIES: NAD(P)H-dependent oxidoreductase [Vibrio]MCM5509997.1 NAD(P)H-dependent oxidoreductase [Vibrio sp. SCSIO 43169]MDE3898335.1 NAD(P)H-dependent oxidoreductase [Vibrio sp. CC007]NOI30418.1 NAD(P)H-dependent oxidoreductase [Vibrio coralliilyticus]NOI50006.1 NAD(P)H-dependent oxidoreductase [Vibrio coralliilyticus]NRF32215.1 NAD(P)H-dependent oxidoreductase [Vibrio coralliilyticus]
MKKILVINANPKSSSLCHALAEHYAESASVRHEVKTIHTGGMNFQPDLSEGYDKLMPLEADLIQFQEKISWADHIVIVTPVWWGTVPAKFKGIIDRTFLSGFAFKYEAGKTLPKKLLKGKTSELIITLDTPVFWYKWVQGNPIYHHLKRTILDFAGIKNLSTLFLGPVIHSKPENREKWVKKVQRRGATFA